MNKKMMILPAAGLTVLLVALLALWLWAAIWNIPDTLLLLPRKPVSAEIDLKSMEEWNGDEILFTYETSSAASVGALHRSHDVTLKKTNYVYHHVMNTPVLSGSFFTKEAQETKQKLAVLNKQAAFTMFGSFEPVGGELNIDGEVYMVTGVIDDRDKGHCNVYVPLDVSEGGADSYAVLAGGGGGRGAPEAAVESKVKQYGVNSADFYFYNLNQFIGGFRARLLLAADLFFMLVFALLMLRSLKGARKRFAELREQSYQFDMAELIYNCKKNVRGFVIYLVSAVLLGGGLLTCLGKATGYVLELLDSGSQMVSDYSLGFTVVAGDMNQLFWYAQTVFILFVALLVLFVLLLVMTCLGPKKEQEKKGESWEESIS